MYLLHILGSGEPQRIHNSFESATEEAERLVKKTGQPCRVYKIIQEVNPKREEVINKELIDAIAIILKYIKK